MSNPFEDLRQAVVVRPMNSPGPQGAAAPHMKIKYSADGVTWHNDPVETDKYLSFSTDNGTTWSDAIYFNNLSETLEWVEKARQWAENPENDEVEPGQYSALHHALQAKKSEITAGEYAIDAAGSAAAAFGAAAPAWDSETVYNYNDVVSFNNGHTYRCIGADIVGADHAPNIDGVDNEAEWTRITVSPDGYFEVDENGDLMPMITPITSEIFMLDGNGDITYQDSIDLEPWGGIELYGKTGFVDSIADLRASSFYGTTEYVYVAGYYGAGTPGGGMFYRDTESSEFDNGGTIIVDADGVRWKRANVHEEYYASWFGVSTDIDDNSPLIQNALNAMPTGSILIFGPGRYWCGQTITIPYDPNSDQAGITLQGSAKISVLQTASIQTVLHYNGPNPATLTPFFDFRCNHTHNQYFRGSIRNIAFAGTGPETNVVGLWFNRCCGSILETVFVGGFGCGIQIDEYYFYCKFNDVLCMKCNYGFRALSIGNGATFNCCNFRYCNIGFEHREDANLNLNGCYFEMNNTDIKSYIGRSLCINQCYFEQTSGYIIDIYDSNADIDSMLILENSYICIGPRYLKSNIGIIKQTLPPNRILTFVSNNNVMQNVYVVPDYFIYVESGDIVIKAENNKFQDTSDNFSFPICSKTPLDTSYFNNDFSE